MKIGIVEGSVREGRLATTVARWVADAAARRADVDHEVLALADFDLPFVDTPTPPAALGAQYPYESVQRWSTAIDACDALILVTPEYNHGVPGALKNAIDWLSGELQNKPAALVSYGADGGVRAVEQWRQTLANFNMHVVRSQVALNLFTEFEDGAIAPTERSSGALDTLLEQLIASASLRAGK